MRSLQLRDALLLRRLSAGRWFTYWWCVSVLWPLFSTSSRLPHCELWEMNFNLCLMVCVFRMINGMKKLLFIYLEALWALRWLKSILAGRWWRNSSFRWLQNKEVKCFNNLAFRCVCVCVRTCWQVCLCPANSLSTFRPYLEACRRQRCPGWSEPDRCLGPCEGYWHKHANRVWALILLYVCVCFSFMLS